MIQSLHIFRKDLRHLWPELGVYALLLIAFAVAAPQAWPGSASSNSLVPTCITLLKILIPISWFVLITRVIHEERLVGEQQFWITRPYHRPSLLIAKCIFIVVGVILPFVLMQWSLLLQAGLSPFASPSGMTFCLLRFCVIVWLPFTVVAAITSTLTEAFMSMMGVVVIWIAMLLTLFRSIDTRMPPPFTFEAFAFIFAMSLIGILILQYSRRRAMRSRIALAATFVIFLILFYGFVEAQFGVLVRALIRSHYPVSSNQSLRLEFIPGSVHYKDRDETVLVTHGFVEVKLPIRLEGLDPDYKLRNTNISFTIDAPRFHYVSPWESVTVDEGRFSFLVPQQVFDRVAQGNAQVHVEFLAEKLRPGNSQIISTSGSFDAPHDGKCVLARGGPVCRYAYQTSVPTRVNGLPGTGTCGASDAAKPSFAIFRMFPVGTNPDPVVQEALALGNICQGSQLTFSEYYPVGNFRLGVDLPSVNFGQYRVR